MKNSVRWIRQAPRGTFVEHIIGENVAGPAHVSTADRNGSGRLDALVASRGQVTPDNDRIGAVVLRENPGNRGFQKRVIVERVARDTEACAASLSGQADGRPDLVVGPFGYAQGETRWMENKGDGKFERQFVNALSGCMSNILLWRRQ